MRILFSLIIAMLAAAPPTAVFAALAGQQSIRVMAESPARTWEVTGDRISVLQSRRAPAKP